MDGFSVSGRRKEKGGMEFDYFRARESIQANVCELSKAEQESEKNRSVKLG
jgi:hypothetical protein